MDHARRARVRTTNDGALSRKATARAKAMRLAFALAVGAASAGIAVAQTINTDATWLATNAAPAAGWNTDPSFDTTGWINASVNIPNCFDFADPTSADCIWYDGQFSTTRYAWLRKTFTVSGPVSSAVLEGGIDDDCDIYVNGNLVFSDHNGTSKAIAPIDVTSSMVQGVNLIAVAAEDNIPVFGANHDFVAELTYVSTGPSAEVPTLSPWMLAVLAIALASIAVLFIVRKA